MASTRSIHLSIIIVNFNSGKLVSECIRSIAKFNPDLAYEIIVVDNASVDNSKELVMAAGGNIQWIEMGYNAGFARANNEGMKRAEGECYLLLNPDTLSIDDSITRCYAQFRQSAYAGCGVQLLDASGIPQISGTHFVKGGLNHLLPLPYWGSFLKWLGKLVKSPVPHVKKAGAEEPVDWISGAFLMVKAAVVERAGLMDEDFFLYAEEVEWCARLRQWGALVIYGELRIIHLEGEIINREQKIEGKGYYNLFDKKGLQLMVSNHLRVRKQYGTAWFLFLLLNYTWGLLLYWTIGSFDQLFRWHNLFHHWSKAMAFTRNMGKLWSLTPKIIAGKPHFYKMMG